MLADMHRIARNVEDLWSRCKVGDRAARDELIVHYADLVRYVAARVGSGLPQNVEQGDLVSYGIFGLIDAIDKFDPDRGYKFETYAISRVKGAILDALRSIDWVPRSVRAKARAVERAHTKLEGELHRSPTPAEIAHELDVPEAQLQATLGQISFAGVAALDEGLEDEEALTLGGTIADVANTPGAAIEIEDLRSVIAETSGRMSDREKAVLILYYHHGLTLAEVGQVFGVTESRVCQIHTKAVQQLRARVLAHEPA